MHDDWLGFAKIDDTTLEYDKDNRQWKTARERTLEAENEQLRQELKQLRADNERVHESALETVHAISDENADLKRQIEHLETERDAALKKAEKFKRMRDKLSDRNQELDEHCRRLEDHCEVAQQNIRSLVEENQQLRKRLAEGTILEGPNPTIPGIYGYTSTESTS